jgi:hypothetical protein
MHDILHLLLRVVHSVKNGMLSIDMIAFGYIRLGLIAKRHFPHVKR